MPTTSGDGQDQLADAYERRTTQLYEARGALADAVSTLTMELRVLREDNRALREQQARASQLEAELRRAFELIETLRNMKVVRWTVWPRTIVYRLRSRGR